MSLHHCYIYIYVYVLKFNLSQTVSNRGYFFFLKCIYLNRITKYLTYVIENRSESFILFYFIPHSALIGVFSIVLFFFFTRFLFVLFCFKSLLSLSQFLFFHIFSFFLSLSVYEQSLVSTIFFPSPFWVEWNSIVLSK